MTSPESYIGRRIDFDGAYGNQCVDLVNQYARDNGLPTFTGGAAADMFGQSPSAYTWVKNTPSGVTPAGAVVIWGRQIGPWGHIAVARAGSDTNILRTVDQNWNYHPYVEPVDHNYNGVIGWGIPKGAASNVTPQGEDMIVNDDNNYARANKLHLYTRGRTLDRSVFNAFVGKPWLTFIEVCLDDKEADQHASNANVGAVAVRDKWDQQIYSLQDQVNKANETIAKLQTQVDDLTAKIGTQGSDTQLLNSIGEVLSKLIVRIGLKK